MPTVDIAQPGELEHYLRQRGWIAEQERMGVHALEGGVSNRTLLVERSAGPHWVVKQALPKLRTAVDWFSDPRRIEREALGLQWLAKLTPPGSTPTFVFLDAENHLLCMTAVPQPHDNWKTRLLRGEIDGPLVRQFGDLLGRMHANGFEQRNVLEPEFADNAYFESLRLEPYYAYTASQVPEAAAFLHALIRDTRQQRLTLVHGDYSPKNALVHAGQLVLLDFEVMHWGDPAFDVGFALAHWLSKARFLPARRDEFLAAAVEFYASYTSRVEHHSWWPELPSRAVRHGVACLLARADGRSPLEYFSDEQRICQRQACLACLRALPASVPELCTLWGSLL